MSLYKFLLVMTYEFVHYHVCTASIKAASPNTFDKIIREQEHARLAIVSTVKTSMTSCKTCRFPTHL